MEKKVIKILGITLLLIMTVNAICYADEIDPFSMRKRYEYTAAYYITIILSVLIVVGISIFILRKIYKSNQINNEETRKMEEIEKQKENNK